MAGENGMKAISSSKLRLKLKLKMSLAKMYAKHTKKNKGGNKCFRVGGIQNFYD